MLTPDHIVGALRSMRRFGFSICEELNASMRSEAERIASADAVARHILGCEHQVPSSMSGELGQAILDAARTTAIHGHWRVLGAPVDAKTLRTSIMPVLAAAMERGALRQTLSLYWQGRRDLIPSGSLAMLEWLTRVSVPPAALVPLRYAGDPIRRVRKPDEWLDVAVRFADGFVEDWRTSVALGSTGEFHDNLLNAVLRETQ